MTAARSRSRFQSTCLREARLGRWGTVGRGRDFNPRACVRHDIRQLDMPGDVTGFQSTCLREARHGVPGLLPDLWDFNPRACVRHDVV